MLVEIDYIQVMESFKRYGMSMKDLSSDAALKKSAVLSKAVPKKHIETPDRVWMKRMIRVVGLFCFVMTVMVFVVGLMVFVISGLGSAIVFGFLGDMSLGLFFVNHLGLFLEMAGDSAGRNWFAKGAGLMWILVLGTFLIAIFVRVFSALF